MDYIKTVLVNYKSSHPLAKEPTYNFPTDAGADLYAASICYCLDYVEYDTGIHIEIPSGYVGLIFPRSSISKTSLSLSNSVGVIDSGYRGSIKLRFKYTDQLMKTYEVGDRIGQLMIVPYPTISFKKVEELSNTERNNGGFGSSGL